MALGNGTSQQSTNQSSGGLGIVRDKQGGNLGVRNNNPGNVKVVGDGRPTMRQGLNGWHHNRGTNWDGVVSVQQADGGTYPTFVNNMYGMRASALNVDTKYKQGLDTPAKLVSVWTATASHRASYAKNIANAAGIGIHGKLDFANVGQTYHVLRAIEKHETGQYKTTPAEFKAALKQAYAQRGYSVTDEQIAQAVGGGRQIYAENIKLASLGPKHTNFMDDAGPASWMRGVLNSATTQKGEPLDMAKVYQHMVEFAHKHNAKESNKNNQISLEALPENIVARRNAEEWQGHAGTMLRRLVDAKAITNNTMVSEVFGDDVKIDNAQINIAKKGDSAVNVTLNAKPETKFGEVAGQINRQLTDKKTAQQKEIADKQQKGESTAAAERRINQLDLLQQQFQQEPFMMLMFMLIAAALGKPELVSQLAQQWNSPNRGYSHNGSNNGLNVGRTPQNTKGGGDTPLAKEHLIHTGGLKVLPTDIATDTQIAALSGQTKKSPKELRESAESIAKTINGLHPDIKPAVLAVVKESWKQGNPIELSSYGQTSHTNDQLTYRRGVDPRTKQPTDTRGVDSRLVRIMEETAREFPLRVRVMSGRYGRNSGRHSQGLAMDITLYDQNGNALGNYQNSQNFRAYELFAQAAYLKTKELYPELADGKGKDFNWGGLFGDGGPGRYKYGSNDTMDFRIENNGNFRAGTIMTGLNKRHGWYDKGDLLGGSKPYDPKSFAADMKKLETLRLTPEQVKYNRETMFGVAKASGKLEPRQEGHFNSRYLAFNVSTKGMDESTRQIFEKYGLSGSVSKQNVVTFHVGEDLSQHAGLSIKPGSDKNVLGGLPIIPKALTHQSWAALRPELNANGRPIGADQTSTQVASTYKTPFNYSIQYAGQKIAEKGGNEAFFHKSAAKLLMLQTMDAHVKGGRLPSDFLTRNARLVGFAMDASSPKYTSATLQLRGLAEQELGILNGSYKREVNKYVKGLGVEGTNVRKVTGWGKSTVEGLALVASNSGSLQQSLDKINVNAIEAQRAYLVAQFRKGGADNTQANRLATRMIEASRTIDPNGVAKIGDHDGTRVWMVGGKEYGIAVGGKGSLEELVQAVEYTAQVVRQHRAQVEAKQIAQQQTTPITLSKAEIAFTSSPKSRMEQIASDLGIKLKNVKTEEQPEGAAKLAPEVLADLAKKKQQEGAAKAS